MRLTYDPDADAAYVYFVEVIPAGAVKRSAVSGIELDGADIVVDFDAEGRILGIEILGASRVLARSTIASPGSRGTSENTRGEEDNGARGARSR